MLVLVVFGGAVVALWVDDKDQRAMSGSKSILGWASVPE
jgi:hypothetical protein